MTRKIPASFRQLERRHIIDLAPERVGRALGAMPSACASDLRRLFETQRQYVSHFFEEVA